MALELLSRLQEAADPQRPASPATEQAVALLWTLGLAIATTKIFSLMFAKLFSAHGEGEKRTGRDKRDWVPPLTTRSGKAQCAETLHRPGEGGRKEEQEEERD